MRVAGRAAVVLAVAPMVGWLAVAAAGIWWRDGFYYFVAEDHVFEWIQVSAFLVAAVGCGTIAALVRRASIGGATIAAFWCALFLIVVGEELAWGQRLFGVSVAAIERANDQGDVSLHNVGPGLALSNVGILGVALAGVLARPGAKWWAARHRRPTGEEWLPPGFLTPWFALAAGYTTLRVAWPSPPARVAKFSEVAELTLALAAAITAIELARTAWHPLVHRAPNGP